MPSRPAVFRPAGSQQAQRFTRPSVAKTIRDSSAWQRLRAYMRGLFPCCPHCEAEGIITPAVEVNHIIRIEVRPDLALEPTNLCPLCARHHDAVSALERAGKPTAHLFNGWAEQVRQAMT